MKGYSEDAWRARSDFIDQVRPARTYHQWNEAHKEIGRTSSGPNCATQAFDTNCRESD
jgi:hypothetical protein